MFCAYPESKSPADSDVIVSIKDVQEQFSIGKVISSTTPKKKYESYKHLSDANTYDYLASYNAAKYAFSLHRVMEAREYAMKALFINPEYKPARALVSKIDGE